MYQQGSCFVQADEPLGKFMDFCTYGHMIDNVVLIVTGTLHERDVHVRNPFLCYSPQLYPCFCATRSGCPRSTSA